MREAEGITGWCTHDTKIDWEPQKAQKPQNVIDSDIRPPTKGEVRLHTVQYGSAGPVKELPAIAALVQGPARTLATPG